METVQSFLTDRMQQIAYSGQLSSVQLVLFGVPQGFRCCRSETAEQSASSSETKVLTLTLNSLNGS